MNEDLDALVRRVDEDRWLASRFAPARVRAGLIAVYAINYEIAASAAARQPGIGAIRLAWWRDALSDLAKAPPHPALQAYAPFAAPAHAEEWARLIEVRERELDPAPFVSWSEAEAFAEASAGAPLRLALMVCGQREHHAELVRDGAIAWGLLALAGRGETLRRRDRSVLPETEDAALVRIGAAYSRLREHSFAAAAFPALGYLALLRLYLESPAVGPIARRWRLIQASARAQL